MMKLIKKCEVALLYRILTVHTVVLYRKSGAELTVTLLEQFTQTSTK